MVGEIVAGWLDQRYFLSNLREGSLKGTLVNEAKLVDTSRDAIAPDCFTRSTELARLLGA